MRALLLVALLSCEARLQPPAAVLDLRMVEMTHGGGARYWLRLVLDGEEHLVVKPPALDADLGALVGSRLPAATRELWICGGPEIPIAALQRFARTLPKHATAVVCLPDRSNCTAACP